MLRFFSIFLVIFIPLYWFVSQDMTWINYFTYYLAEITYAIMNAFDTSIVIKPSSTLEHTLAIGHADGFFITVTESCSALQALVLLLSALAAFPMSWKMRLLGIAFGFLFIQLINIVRLISLVYIGHKYPVSTFDFVHENAWPLMMHLCIYAFFLLWISYLAKQSQADE